MRPGARIANSLRRWSCPAHYNLVLCHALAGSRSLACGESLLRRGGTHWGGEWVVGARGLYYLNEQLPGSLGIDFLPFGSDSRRTVRVAPLLAPAARHSSLFALAPDESWLVWAQEDYRNTDIMMVAQR
jgi:hypothetical protein